MTNERRQTHFTTTTAKSLASAATTHLQQAVTVINDAQTLDGWRDSDKGREEATKVLIDLFRDWGEIALLYQAIQDEYRLKDVLPKPRF